MEKYLIIDQTVTRVKALPTRDLECLGNRNTPELRAQVGEGRSVSYSSDGVTTTVYVMVGPYTGIYCNDLGGYSAVVRAGMYHGERLYRVVAWNDTTVDESSLFGSYERALAVAKTFAGDELLGSFGVTL